MRERIRLYGDYKPLPGFIMGVLYRGFIGFMYLSRHLRVIVCICKCIYIYIYIYICVWTLGLHIEAGYPL